METTAICVEQRVQQILPCLFFGRHKLSHCHKIISYPMSTAMLYDCIEKNILLNELFGSSGKQENKTEQNFNTESWHLNLSLLYKVTKNFIVLKIILLCAIFCIMQMKTSVHMQHDELRYLIKTD